jgi:LPXTG-motif cell wall-anchored protein
MSQFLIAAVVVSSGRDDNPDDLVLVLAIIGIAVMAFAALIYWLVKKKKNSN